VGPTRKVTLEIHVNDKEVVVAEKSVNRLKAAADGVGASGNRFEQFAQKIKAAFGEAGVRGAINSFSKDGSSVAQKYVAELQKVLPASEAAAGSMSRVAISAGAVAGALVAAVAIVGIAAYAFVQLAQKVFEVTKAYADYAVEVGKLAEANGLAVETTAALRVQAERTGTSFDALNAPIANFRKTIGEAAAGSETARASLRLLGIDGSKAIYDIDGAFRQAISTIVKLPAGMDQSRALFAAFGAEGYKLLPFLKSFNGNVDAAIKKAEELGLMLSGKDVQSAKAFQQAYTDLQKAIQGLTNLFGREFMPTVTAALRDFTGWLTTNKNTVKDWAAGVGTFVSGVITAFGKIIKFVKDHPILTRILLGVATTGGSEAVISTIQGVQGIGTQPMPPSVPPAIKYDRPQDAPPDLAAMDAARAEFEKKMKETIERNKRDWDATIELWKASGEDAGNTLTRIFDDLKEKFATSGDASAFEQGAAQAQRSYLSKIAEIFGELEQLEDERARRNNVTAKEQQLLDQQQFKRRQEWAQKGYDIGKQTQDLITKAEQKGAEERIKTLEGEMNRAIEIRTARNATDIAQTSRDYDTQLLSERQKIDRINKLELDSIEFRKRELQKFLTSVAGNAEKEKEIRHQIKVVDEQIAQQQITNANRITEAEKKKLEALEQLRKQYEDIRNSLEDQITVLSRGNRPLTVYEQTVRSLERDYKDLSAEQKENLLVLAQQVDALEKLNKQHAELKDFFKETLTYVFEGDFSGLVENLTRKFRDAFIDKLSDFLATEILGFDPSQTDNPVAKPIVSKIDVTNKILNSILGRLGGTPITGGGLGGGLSSIFSGVFGAGLGGNIAPGGTGVFNPGFFTGPGRTGSISTLPNGEPAFNVNGSGGGSFLDRLKRIFSTQEGGIFAPVPNVLNNNQPSALGGILSGAGSIAQIAGGLIGGRAGSAISMAGLGLQIGAMFGPWGAAIGAGAGFLIGLLGFSDPKRKRDKNEKLPQLQKGFTDAIAELRQILADSQALRFSDPQEAVTRAEAVRAQIASGFGIQFESKKYRKQAQSLIATRLREADPLIEQIKQSAAIAAGAADRRQRILPEFAGGYFADFFKPNGLLPGMFDGRDNILAMISRGEMVLNPYQQNRVRSMAGFDIFAGAGIPNYPNPSTSSRLAIGGLAGAALGGISPNVVMQPQFTLIAQGVIFPDESKVWLMSDDGRRTLVKVIREEKKKDRTLVQQ
jgi:hypothetical protein